MTNNDRFSDEDKTASERLVSALRAEIAELEFDDEPEDMTLPDDIRRLLVEAPVPAKVASAVDDLVASDQPVADGFAAALRASVRDGQAEHGIGIVFLEQRVAHQRMRGGIEATDVATRLSSSAEIVEGIESGRLAFDEVLSEEQVAEWIKLLELDFEDSLAALQRSLYSPALSYAGDPDDHRRQAIKFVAAVREILFRDV